MDEDLKETRLRYECLDNDERELMMKRADTEKKKRELLLDLTIPSKRLQEETELLKSLLNEREILKTEIESERTTTKKSKS